MTTSLIPPREIGHHRIVGSVEQRHYAAEIRRLLLSIVAPEKQTQQLHKDVQSEKNRAPETVASMIDVAIKTGQESKAHAIANAISAFCSFGKTRVQRSFRQLYPLETQSQGELDNVEVAVEQGDESNPTLARLVTKLDANMAHEQQMKEWALERMHATQAVS